MTDAPAPEYIPVEPSQPGPEPLAGEMNLPEDEPQEEPKAEPEKAEKPAKSLDDSLKDAFKKGREEAEKKAAEKAEKPAEEKPEPKVDPKAEESPDPKAEDQTEEEPKPTSFKEAPSRFDDTAKKEWEAVPESVRGSVHRMQRELESGIEKYRQQTAEYDEVREYSEMAKKSGTTLKTALDQYVGIEQALRQNPISGLEQVVTNLGLKDNQGNPLTLRNIAMHIAGQTPDKVSAQQDQTITQLRQQVQQLTQSLGGIQQSFQRQETAQREQSAASEWDSFVKENPRATELEGEIAETLRKYPSGDNITIRERLEDAFAIVARRHPEAAHTGDALAHTQAPEPRQPKPEGRKSISGAPSAQTLTPSGKKKSPPSIDEALKNAVRRAS